jgi:tetratricopeptide (TPR) repeat protein
VKSLDLVLSEGAKRAIAAIPSKNLEAYQTYLRGLSFSNSLEKSNLEMTIELFDRAVKLDSTFALAYAELSIAHLNYYWLGFDRTMKRMASAKQCLDRAFVLQGDLPEAYVALGYYYYFGYRNYDRALEALGIAEKKLPNNNRALEAVAYIWRRQGKFEAAVEQLKRVFDLDPKDAALPVEIGNTLRMIGKYADAEVYLDRSIALLPDESEPYIWKAAIDLLWHGDTKKSRGELERVPKQYERWLNLTWLDIYDRNFQSALDRLAHSPSNVYEDNFSVIPVSQLRGLIYRFANDSLRSRTSFDSARVYLESELAMRPDDYRVQKSLAIVYAGLGRAEEAVRRAGLVIELLPVSQDAWAGVSPLITRAQVYAMVGEKDRALAELEYIFSLHAAMEITPSILRLDPLYDPLRGEARFQALISRDEK